MTLRLWGGWTASGTFTSPASGNDGPRTQESLRVVKELDAVKLIVNREEMMAQVS